VEKSAPEPPHHSSIENHAFESYADLSSFEFPLNTEEKEPRANTKQQPLGQRQGPFTIRLSDFPELQSAGPILQITKGEEELDMFAVFTVLSTMINPEDETGRRLVAASLRFQYAEDFVRRLTGNEDPAGNEDSDLFQQVLLEVSNEWLKSYGGISVLNRSRSIEENWASIEQGIHKGLMVGLILCLALMMAKSGYPTSINRAISMIEQRLKELPNRGQKSGPLSEGRLIKLWKKYKPVAHLWAAYQILHRDYEETDPARFLNLAFMSIELPELLAVAEICRRFGTQFKPLNTNKPLLDPAESWRCPKGLQLTDLAITIPPFSDWGIEILGRYQARVRC
jgi:hypothetical protein